MAQVGIPSLISRVSKTTDGKGFSYYFSRLRQCFSLYVLLFSTLGGIDVAKKSNIKLFFYLAFAGLEPPFQRSKYCCSND